MALRIGILGAARIARDFVVGVRPSSRVKVVSVASRDPARAEAFARGLEIDRWHASYEELLADDGVDAIYLALPNGLHGTWAITAARAGKHVLCEKPLAAHEIEGRAMFSVAAECGTVLMEGFPYQHQHQTRQLLQLVRNGAVGDVRAFQGAFGFPLTDPQDVRLDRALAGGALRDLGCYPLSLARLVFGSRPHSASAHAVWHPGGVDWTLAGTVEFEGGLAQIACSLEVAATRQAVIAGSGGVLETDFRNHTDVGEPPKLKLRRRPGGSGTFELLPVERANGFLLEAEAFADLVESQDPDGQEAHKSAVLDVLGAIDALISSARTGMAANIPQA